MEQLIRKYAKKTVSHGLADPGAPLLGGLDADLAWNRKSSSIPVLEKVFSILNINSLFLCWPKEPYASIINYLVASSSGAIFPKDTETRTFLHDLPVVKQFSSESIANELKRRKCVIIPNKGIITFGTVSPEQAFVTFSSVLFACFVKFHADALAEKRAGEVNPSRLKTLKKIIPLYSPLPRKPPVLLRGPFDAESNIHQAMMEAANHTVGFHLVDSFFGNISYRANNTLYISQTGSSMDELEGCIDACPLDGSSSTGLTASSELTAHMRVLTETENRAILHGHPKFPVILSLDCAKSTCEFKEECHLRCPENRFMGDTPIIPGEVGNGPYGLSKTLPPALQNHPSVIVHGHGLFTTGKIDFNDAFANMLETEGLCRLEYLKRLDI